MFFFFNLASYLWIFLGSLCVLGAVLFVFTVALLDTYCCWDNFPRKTLVTSVETKLL